MTKSEIVAKVLNEFRNETAQIGMPERVRADYDEEIVAAVEKSLRDIEPDEQIRTCEDFRYLNVDCCQSCHSIYQHYELSLTDIEGVGRAWICCALDRALNPTRHPEFPHSPESADYGEMLAEFERRRKDAK